MEVVKISDKNYRVEKKQKAVETVKIAKISLIVLFVSFIVMFATSINADLLLKSNILLVVFLLSSITFEFTFFFSTLLLFLSKRHSDNMCLRLACYVIIAIVVALTAIITTLIVNQLLPIISNPNLDITADKLTNILTEIAGQIAPYVIAIIILSILFDLSMLVSFKIKSMKNDTAILEIVVCYVLISFAKIIVYLLPSSIAQLTLLVEISCLACLYYILEDRTTEVISLVSAEEERAPVKNIEVKGPIKEQYNLRQELLDRKYVPGIPSRKTSDEEIERINIIRDYYSRKREMTMGLFYRILLEVVFIVVVAFVSGAIFSFNGVVSPWAFVAELILTGIISFALFYIILGKNLKKIDIISIICLMLGGTLITLNYSFNELPIILLGVFGVLGALAFIVGGARFFFLKKQPYIRFAGIIRLIAFVVFCIVLLYYLLGCIFSPEVKLQIIYITPYLYGFIALTMGVTYFIYKLENIIFRPKD